MQVIVQKQVGPHLLAFRALDDREENKANKTESREAVAEQSRHLWKPQAPSRQACLSHSRQSSQLQATTHLDLRC